MKIARNFRPVPQESGTQNAVKDDHNWMITSNGETTRVRDNKPQGCCS